MQCQPMHAQVKTLAYNYILYISSSQDIRGFFQSHCQAKFDVRTDRRLPFLYPDIRENQAEHLATRSTTTIDPGSEGLLAKVEVNHAHPQNGGHTPHMRKGDESKIQSPETCYPDPAEECEDVVATTLATVKAGIRRLPNAVNAMSAIYFRQYVVESCLKV